MSENWNLFSVNINMLSYLGYVILPSSLPVMYMHLIPVLVVVHACMRTLSRIHVQMYGNCIPYTLIETLGMMEEPRCPWIKSCATHVNHVKKIQQSQRERGSHMKKSIRTQIMHEEIDEDVYCAWRNPFMVYQSNILWLIFQKKKSRGLASKRTCGLAFQRKAQITHEEICS